MKKTRAFLSFVILLFFTTSISSQENTLQKRYKNHIKTLEYISRKTDNSKYYLTLALKYCDSLEDLNGDKEWISTRRKKIDQTLQTCTQNMNHKVQLFPFFKGIPSHMGFADDAIEYAYDDALNTLFETLYGEVERGPISEASITSVLTRGDCEDGMFEIIRQTILSKTKHHLLSYQELVELVGQNKAEAITNKETDSTILNELCEKLNLNKIGVFHANDIDKIEDKIFYVYTSFKSYSPKTGFNQAIVSKGFCEDKIGVIGLNIPLLIIESILFISLLAFIEEKIFRLRKRGSKISLKEIFTVLKDKIIYTTICFAIPSILSFVMIWSISFIMPEGPDHFMETISVLWVLLLTICMSIIPTALNLFVVNRLQIDGFHNYRGYRTFANASIYATYLPLFVFYLIYFEQYPRYPHFLLVILSFVVGELLARSYFTYTSKTKYRNIKLHGIIGLFLGVCLLLVFNTYILSELSVRSLIESLVVIVPLTIIHYFAGKILQKNNAKKSLNSEEKNLLNELPYLNQVLDPIEDIYHAIEQDIDTGSLNIGIVDAPMGMGKTRALKHESKEIFEKNKWAWYYGDCDEIQDENAISYEPFLEAFKKLLCIEAFPDRSAILEKSIGSPIQNILEEVSPIGSIIGDYNKNKEKSMTDISVEIVEQLQNQNKKAVFILEDLHWIDAESYAFLKFFLQTVNRNEFLRSHLYIILTIRSDYKTGARGINHDQLIKDLEELKDSFHSPYSLVQKMSIKSLLTKKNFKISDFVKNLSEADNKFKLQNEAAYHINELINDEIAKESSSAIQDFHVTPLYILKVLEKWINDKTLLFSPDGYSLSKALSSEDLPNSDEIDSFYHSILDGYDTKWQRLLESAAIIGNKFNAEVLSHVWGYELLSVLDFLEKAESDNLITDLSEEDNIYEFKDKRIISAINNYFSTSRENGTKQIVIEYNKRYLNQQKHVIENPHLYPIEDLLMVVRRAIPLLKNNEIKQKIQLLFSNLIVRMLGNKQHHELNAFIDHIEQKEMSSLSNLLRGLNAIANIDNGFDKVLKKGSEIQNSIYAHSFENELRLIALLYKKERLKEENNQKTVLNIEEINYLKDRILNHYKGDELVIITALFMQNVDLAQKDKLSLLEHIKNRTDNLPYLNIYLEIIEFHVKNKSNISDKVKNEITKDLINKSSDIGNKHLLKTCLQLRIKTLSSDLKKHDEAINEFKSFSSKLLDNTLNIHWIETCLKLMNGSSGDLYLETHKSDYENQIKIIEDFIYKRYDEHAFNRLIKLFSEAKLKFLKQANQKDLLKNYKEKYLEIIKKELGESHPYYDRFKES